MLSLVDGGGEDCMSKTGNRWQHVHEIFPIPQTVTCQRNSMRLCLPIEQCTLGQQTVMTVFVVSFSLMDPGCYFSLSDFRNFLVS